METVPGHEGVMNEKRRLDSWMWVEQRKQIRKEKCKEVLTTSDLEHAYSFSVHQPPLLVMAFQISHRKCG